MKRIIVIAFLVWFAPHIVSAATATQETLKSLDVDKSAWNALLSSDTQGWKSGKIGGVSIRFAVHGDVIGYDAQNRTWWRLITPISTELPITALALCVNDTGVVTRKIVTLEAGNDGVTDPVKEENVPSRSSIQRPGNRAVVSESYDAKASDMPRRAYPVVKSLPQSAIETLPMEKSHHTKVDVESLPKVVTENRQKAEHQSVAIQEKNDAITVASIRDFMAVYQRQINGGE